MNTIPDQKQSGGETPQIHPAQQGSSTEEDVQVSQPQTDRPEGPFEHSGETSGWTEEERKEKQEQDQQ